VLAALLAHKGYTAGCTILEGPMGYIQAVSPKPDLSLLDEGLGEKFSIMEVALKSYPSSHLTHAAVEATERVVKDHAIGPEDVEKVDVGVVNVGYLLDKTFPKDAFAASMNIPYLVSFALRYGVGPRQITTDNLHDGLLAEIFQRVDVHVDDEVERQRPKYLGAVVSVRTKGGMVFKERCLTPRGDPENPFTDDEIYAKFEALTGGLIPAEHQKRLRSMTMNLDQVQDIGEILPLTRRPS